MATTGKQSYSVMFVNETSVLYPNHLIQAIGNSCDGALSLSLSLSCSSLLYNLLYHLILIIMNMSSSMSSVTVCTITYKALIVSLSVYYHYCSANDVNDGAFMWHCTVHLHNVVARAQVILCACACVRRICRGVVLLPVWEDFISPLARHLQ